MKKIILLTLFTISILTPINIFAQAEIVGGVNIEIVKSVSSIIFFIDE